MLVFETDPCVFSFVIEPESGGGLLFNIFTTVSWNDFVVVGEIEDVGGLKLLITGWVRLRGGDVVDGICVSFCGNVTVGLESFVLGVLGAGKEEAEG